jgi:hypothetical protein
MTGVVSAYLCTSAYREGITRKGAEFLKLPLHSFVDGARARSLLYMYSFGAAACAFGSGLLAEALFYFGQPGFCLSLSQARHSFRVLHVC